MPARKPSNLITRHETAAQQAERAAREQAVHPGRALPKAAPASLRGHAVAREAWRRLMRTYGDIEGEIVTKLDQDLLVTYCVLVEQLSELDLMRKTTYRQWLELGVAHDQAILKALEAKKAADETVKMVKETGGELPEKGPGSLAEVEKWEDRAVALAAKCLDAFEAVLKLDSRADRKRDLLFKHQQSMYLTPRARAGVAPDRREVEEPKDALGMLLDGVVGDVTGFVNGGGEHGAD